MAQEKVSAQRRIAVLQLPLAVQLSSQAMACGQVKVVFEHPSCEVQLM